MFSHAFSFLSLVKGVLFTTIIRRITSKLCRNLEICILWVISGHALMISAGFLLKKLAHEHNIAVLVSFAFVSLSSFFLANDNLFSNYEKILEGF